MAYDDELAGRLRDLLAEEPAAAGLELTEKKMFGGLGFMVGGHMAVAASGQGGLMVRVDPAEGAELVATTPAYPMEMRGRTMSGWLRVDLADLATDEALGTWVRRGASYVAGLPPKSPGR
ncbi:TfoX/Sxy family protein [Nocardioides sp. LHD-245]|uniref:TfoX/Sxy family protein n=1 Tax=Nocardioides sp. LHD-245 TaxID=3051387 RepID=UPI0027E03845|nr:TfoX/Sxy family protein [Nocardioides sp. LHD-245]